jgi:hypothetical protein
VVCEALVGLPGIESVDPDLTNDLLRVHYDPERATPEQMLKVVDEQGFDGKIVSAGSSSSS